jgi:spermidine/putrescine transport system ATP-binding protein
MQLMLKHLQRDVGITFVYVTHDQGEALAMSDRLAVMSDGRIHQIGTPDEVYFEPRTTFVASFIGKTNLLDAERVDETSVRAGNVVVRLARPVPKDRVIVSVRPESIAIGDGAAAGPNAYDGVIREVIFLGSERELLVDVSGQTLLVKAPSTGAAFAAGSPIRVGWAPEACVVVADAEGSAA